MSIRSIYTKITEHLESVVINDISYTVSYKMIKATNSSSIICKAIDDQASLCICEDNIPYISADIDDIIQDVIIHLHTDYVDLSRYAINNIYTGIAVADYLGNKQLVKILVNVFHRIAFELGKMKIVCKITLANSINRQANIIIKRHGNCPKFTKVINNTVNEYKKSHVTTSIVHERMDAFNMESDICKLSIEPEKILQIELPKLFNNLQINLLCSIFKNIDISYHGPLTTAHLFGLFSSKQQEYLRSLQQYKLPK